MRLNDLPFPIYGDTSWRGKCPSEAMEQMTFFNTLRREYPATWGRLALHPRNEGQRKGGQIKAMIQHKAEGLTPGASDIIIPARVTFVCELKRQDHTQSKWQDGQREYLEAAHNAGAFACVALGWKGAWAALMEWQDVAQ